MTWALRDSWTVTLRDLGHWRRQPWDLLIGLAFPILLLLMFGFLLGGAIDVPGGYIEFLFPGMLAVTMAFGLESTMTYVSQDVQRGVTDRFRSLPMSRIAVLLGRATADMLASVVGLAVLLVAGRRDRVADPRGHRQRAGRRRAAAAPAVRVPLGRHLPRAAVPRAGRRDGGPDPGVAVRLPVERVRADLDDARLAADAVGVEPGHGDRRGDARAVRQPDRGGSGWASENVVLLAVVWPVVLSVVFATLAVRRWARLGR